MAESGADPKAGERRAVLFGLLALLLMAAAIMSLSPLFRLSPRPDGSSAVEDSRPASEAVPGAGAAGGRAPLGAAAGRPPGSPAAPQAGAGARRVLKWLWPFWDGTSRGASAAFAPAARDDEGGPEPERPAGAAPTAAAEGRRLRRAVTPNGGEAGRPPAVRDSTLSVYAPADDVLSAGSPGAIGGGGAALDAGGVELGRSVPPPAELPKAPDVKKGTCVPAGDWASCDSVGKRELTDGRGVVWTRWECLKRSIDGTWALLFQSSCNPRGAP